MNYPVTTIPATAHSVFYSYAILFKGNEIGSFQNFASSFTRTSERIREILFSHGPITNEIVWGGTDIQVTLSRVELYQEAILQALGRSSGVFSIEQFNFVVDIAEVMQRPPTGANVHDPAPAPGGRRVITYRDCVPTNVGKTVDVGTVHVVETMTLECRTVEGQIY